MDQTLTHKNQGWKLTLITIALLTLSSAFSQAQTFEWLDQMNSNGDWDATEGMAVDDEGYIYAVGQFEGKIDVDPDTGVFYLISSGGSDLFVKKLTPNGKLVWAFKLGGNGDDAAKAVKLDGEGHMYIAGYFSGFVNFHPSATMNGSSKGSSDGFVLKMDTVQNSIWLAHFGGAANFTSCYDLDFDKLGGVYIAGGTSGWSAVDFDPSSNNHLIPAYSGSLDGFNVKLDTARNFQWAHRIGGVGYDRSRAIATDAANNCYIVGWFRDTVDFDPGPDSLLLVSKGGYDIYVQKVNPNGDMIWTLSFGSTGQDTPEDVCIGPGEDVILSGYFSDTVDFDPGAGMYTMVSNEHTDIFNLRLDSAGAFKWAVGPVGGPLNDIAQCTTIDKWGNLYVAGHFHAKGDFDPGPGKLELRNEHGFCYVQKLDNQGNLIWVKNFASTGSASYAEDIVIDNDLSIYIGGNFSDTADFDPDTTINLMEVSNGLYDAFVLKLTQECLPIDTSVTVTGDSILNAASGGITYQWIDCGNDNSVISGADSSTFEPADPGYYAVVINSLGCADTSSCHWVSGTTSVREIMSNQVRVFPNPSDGIFQIDLGDVKHNVSLTITDLQGRVVYERSERTGQMIQVELNEPAGVYVLRVSGEAGNYQSLVVKR